MNIDVRDESTGRDTVEASFGETHDESPLARPRVRWPAIIWGSAFAAVATALLVVLLDPAARAATSALLSNLTPGTAALAGLLVVGGLLLIAGVAGLAARGRQPQPE